VLGTSIEDGSRPPNGAHRSERRTQEKEENYEEGKCGHSKANRIESWVRGSWEVVSKAADVRCTGDDRTV
jgi:hypothetical protein